MIATKGKQLREKKKNCRACSSTKDRRKRWYKEPTREQRVGSSAIPITRRDTLQITALQEKKEYRSSAVEMKKGVKRMFKHPAERQGNKCTWMEP